MTQPRRSDLQPIETHDTRTFLVGTALWVIALAVVLLVVRPDDARPAWTCVVGIGLGLFGIGYVRRRDSRERRRPPEV